MQKHVDYIIVGGGISGCVLGYTLMKYGASVVVYDLPKENKCSTAASGLWNPIVLKRMKKVWKADEMMAELHAVYPDMEVWTSVKFFDPISIRRVFHNAEEQNTWMELCDSPAFSPYLKDCISPLPDGIVGKFESGRMKGTGRLNVLAFMEAVREALRKENSFRSEHFEWDTVVRDAEGLDYSDLRAHAVISCQGAQMALGETVLQQEGFAPVKGEILRVKLDAPMENECIHQKHFMLSEGNAEVTVGATYAWEGFNDGPSTEKREELEQHVSKVWNGSSDTMDHLSGIRPATKDRRPMVGPHRLPHTWVFGGMGSRAVLMAPYLAKVLVEHFMYGTDLLEECLPKRFY